MLSLYLVQRSPLPLIAALSPTFPSPSDLSSFPWLSSTDVDNYFAQEDLVDEIKNVEDYRVRSFPSSFLPPSPSSIPLTSCRLRLFCTAYFPARLLLLDQTGLLHCGNGIWHGS
eukprot:1264489-Rhodomonas_salina.2